MEINNQLKKPKASSSRPEVPQDLPGRPKAESDQSTPGSPHAAPFLKAFPSRSGRLKAPQYRPQLNLPKPYQGLLEPPQGPRCPRTSPGRLKASPSYPKASQDIPRSPKAPQDLARPPTGIYEYTIEFLKTFTSPPKAPQNLSKPPQLALGLVEPSPCA